MHAHVQRASRAPSISSEFPVRLAVILLASAWLLVILADLGGLHVVDSPFWFRLFAEGAVVEWFQWFFLAGCVIASAFLWGRAAASGRDHARAFALLAIGFAIMLIEDSGNLRHRIGNSIVYAIYGDFEKPETLLAKNAFEMAFYVLIASCVMLPVLRLWPRLRDAAMLRRFLGAGVACYFVAAASSATSGFGYWYEAVGSRLLALAPADPQDWSALKERLEDNAFPYTEFGHTFMDTLYEESLELLGAAFLLAFLVRLARSTDRQLG